MKAKKNILIVDDSVLTRSSLRDMLESEYGIYEASDGEEALAFLNEHAGDLSAILTDIYMPNMDGFEFLRRVKEDDRFSSIPVLVSSSVVSTENEKKVLLGGAWEFVGKPYDSDILKIKLSNAIERSEVKSLRMIKRSTEYDPLTNIPSAKHFFNLTRAMLDENPDEKFVFVRFDVDRFQLINDYYGTREGDQLLIYISKALKKYMSLYKHSTYGRIEADVFAFCIDNEGVVDLIGNLRYNIEQFNREFNVIPSFGVYSITDNKEDIAVMFNKAKLAAKGIKGSYSDVYRFYDEHMSEALNNEQHIINEMGRALGARQFEVYYQPKYDILNDTLCGSEALVRWKHPVRGMISPGEFIPLFERNGYITKLDYYVWEDVCRTIRRWLDEKQEVVPVSVNVSRVNIYNPNIVDMFTGLLEKYDIPSNLFQLEITESAYMDDPDVMKMVMTKLHDKGFRILMDDFGSGYSSLNMLNDMNVDEIKIDMRFLAHSKDMGKSRNILASVIRMARWLKLPALVEGVETMEQLKFLRSVGCEFVQGYFYGRPMPVEEFEVIQRKKRFGSDSSVMAKNSNMNLDEMFENNPQLKWMFSDLVSAMAVYEVDGSGNVSLLRVNDTYYDLFGADEVSKEFIDVTGFVADSDKEIFSSAFLRVCDSKKREEILFNRVSDKNRWINLRLKYVRAVANLHIVIGALEDVTKIHENAKELADYRSALNDGKAEKFKLLIADDSAVDRVMIRNVFAKDYDIYEANNGKDAIDIINNESIDVVMLDLIMPQMDGQSFLEYRSMKPELLSIPVVVITAMEDDKLQTKMAAYNISDYIIKPFVPEVMEMRVNNVLEANVRMREVIKKYSQIARLARIDQMTVVYNRVTAIKLIDEIISAESNTPHALIMVDVDNFKRYNDEYGHPAGDKIISLVAGTLRKTFRNNDIIGRLGGDEFVVFMYGVDNRDLISGKCSGFNDKIMKVVKDELKIDLSCSFGVSLYPEHGKNFDELYSHADSALYIAKAKGKNTCVIYNEEDLKI